MLVVISPAKSLDLNPPARPLPLSQPELRTEIRDLAEITRRLTPADLRALMDISDKLADLNHARFQAFDAEAKDGLPAALMFNGDVYAGLEAKTLSDADLAWAQDRLRILSGLYGILRPLDGILPYRLEMGTRLKTPAGNSLYAYWADTLAHVLNATAEGHADRTLINLASSEYFDAVDQKALTIPVLSIRFLEQDPKGKRKIISFYAKKARGLMARYIIENRIEHREALKGFDVAGYAFDPDSETPDTWTFWRKQPPGKAA